MAKNCRIRPISCNACGGLAVFHGKLSFMWSPVTIGGEVVREVKVYKCTKCKRKQVKK